STIAANFSHTRSRGHGRRHNGSSKGWCDARHFRERNSRHGALQGMARYRGLHGGGGSHLRGPVRGRRPDLKLPSLARSMRIGRRRLVTTRLPIWRLGFESPWRATSVCAVGAKRRRFGASLLHVTERRWPVGWPTPPHICRIAVIKGEAHS